MRKTLKNVAKGSQNEAGKVTQITKIELKGWQSEPRDFPKKPFGNRVENILEQCIKYGSIFDQKSIQQIINNKKKTIAEEHVFNTESMLTWSQFRYQNSSKIVA